MPTIHLLDKGIYYLLVLYALAATSFLEVQRIAITLALCLFLYRYYREPFNLQLPKKLTGAIGLFLVASLLSSLFAFQPYAGLKAVWTYLGRIAPLFLTVFVIREQKQALYLIYALVISLAVSDTYALWQGLHGDLRAHGFSHYMTFAGYLVQLIPLLLVLAIENTNLSPKIRYGFFAILGLSFAALLFNGTRGAWIAVALTVIAYAIACIKRKPILFVKLIAVLIIFTVLAVGMPQFHNRTMSISDISHSQTERVLMWKSAWQMFLDHWLIGVGPGNYGDLYKQQYILPEAKERDQGHAHNSYLQVLAETGIVGFTAFCLMFGYILYDACRQALRRRSWGVVTLLVTLGFLIHGCTEYNFGTAAVMRLYWFIVGLSYASMNILRNSESP